MTRFNCHRRKSWQQPRVMHQTDHRTQMRRHHQWFISGEGSHTENSVQSLNLTFQDNKSDVVHDEIVQEGDTLVVNKSNQESYVPCKWGKGRHFIVGELTLIVLPLCATGVIYFKWSLYCPHTSKSIKLCTILWVIDSYWKVTFSHPVCI